MLDSETSVTDKKNETSTTLVNGETGGERSNKDSISAEQPNSSSKDDDEAAAAPTVVEEGDNGNSSNSVKEEEGYSAAGDAPTAAVGQGEDEPAADKDMTTSGEGADKDAMEVDKMDVKKEEDGDVKMEDADADNNNNTDGMEDGDDNDKDDDQQSAKDKSAKGGDSSSDENDSSDDKPADPSFIADHTSTRVKAEESTKAGTDEEKKPPNGTANSNEANNKNNSKSSGEQNKPENNTNTSTTPAPAADALQPPPPVLRGTLSYNIQLRKHQIRGMWNYENATALSPQRFELVRTLNDDEDVTALPTDGEFHGSFSLAYIHTTSKGKQKERAKVIMESGVNIKFTKMDGSNEYKVDGKGNNQFGIFYINGTATPSTHDEDPSYNIVLRKRYEPSTAPPAPVEEGNKKKAKNADPDVLPPPSKSFPRNVVCLRGTLVKDESFDVGATDVVHRITGMWAAGLDVILADPQNVNGQCNRFEYEHKSTVPTTAFPVSGKYTGWFDLTDMSNPEVPNKNRIHERDVTLKFIKNNAGYHNVEGKGTNTFGRYTITGTLTLDRVLTIFRQFQARKIKASKSSQLAVTSAPPPINTGGQAGVRRSSMPAPEQQIKMDEVKVPGEDSGRPLPPVENPVHGSYSAVSRGTLKLGEDGSHVCSGKWAVVREHFNSTLTSNFNFRLEAHFAAEAAKEQVKRKGEVEEGAIEDESPATKSDEFPLDSTMYKGTFQLKKNAGRHQTIVDNQIVMKFRKSTSGSYNVYGRGFNAIGVFNLVGTLVMLGKQSGQVELYRMYPPELLAAPPAAKLPSGPPNISAAASKVPSYPKASDAPALAPSTSTIMPSMPAQSGLVRRESTRLVKLPSRLEDDDPDAQFARCMDKCSQILRFMREKDVERGAFFSEPVNPVALGIPTYTQVIKEPMDLRTVHQKMEANDMNSPEEFGRMMRLIFENAMTFNVDPGHSVHITARHLLTLFNQKFRDVERMLENLRRVAGPELDEKGKKKKLKEDKKRKRALEEPKSLKRMRLEEAQEMAATNANTMAALAAAAPASAASVSRAEFNMMVNMIQELQKQMVRTHNALAELSPGDDTDNAAAGGATAMDISDVAHAAYEPVSAPAPSERKKSKKKASESIPRKQPVEEPAVIYDETIPLTLQEQELLTETINNMPSDHLPGVIQIIRESATLDDEEEIDLEIDQLDTVTQRKLLRHVSKYIKPAKKGGKGRKKAKTAAAPVPAPSLVPEPKQGAKKADKNAAPKKQPSPKSRTDSSASFFQVFGSKDEDSDSDSDDDEPPKQTANTSAMGGKHLPSASASKSDGFDLGDGFGGLNDDNEDDELGNGGITANWNISKPVAEKTVRDSGDDDDAWGAARVEAAAVEARKADRKAREEKLEAEAEEAKKRRLEEAKKEGEKLLAKRMEEEENEARRKLEKEKEAKDAQDAAREAVRAQVQSVEQTVDLDAQRDIMKQYEQSFLDKELGSASPSSDFGF